MEPFQTGLSTGTSEPTNTGRSERFPIHEIGSHEIARIVEDARGPRGHRRDVRFG